MYNVALFFLQTLFLQLYYTYTRIIVQGGTKTWLTFLRCVKQIVGFLPNINWNYYKLNIVIDNSE